MIRRPPISTPCLSAAASDVFKRQEKTRRRVYDMVVAEKLQVQGFHYPFPGLGNVEKDGGGYRVVPAPWNPTI
jgi:hypothetical protein